MDRFGHLQVHIDSLKDTVLLGQSEGNAKQSVKFQWVVPLSFERN